MDPALWELLRTGSNDDAEEIEAIIRLDRPHVEIAGVRIISRFGPIATCRLRRDSILRVREEENVLSLKAARSFGPEVEPKGLNARLKLPPTSLVGDLRRPPGLPLTGAGVVIGIIDWGCDFNHPNFKHPDGTTRLIALWDQRGRLPPGAHSRYGYGTVHGKRQINYAITSADPYGALGYHPADADPGGSGTHGTHVMGIAAGNGLGGGPMGVAPEADLIFVHLANKDEGGLANLGDSVRILEAVDFVARTAGNKPWVINLSVGRHGGPHDGSTLCELAIDFMLNSAPNRFVVQSAGNYFNKSIHSSGRLKTGQTRTLNLRIDEADVTPNELEVWYPGEDELAVKTESPHGTLSPWVSLGQHADIIENSRIVGRIYNRASDPNNTDNHIDIFLYSGAPPGAWNVTIRADKISDGVFHAWLERDDACPGCQTQFSKSDSDSSCTIGTLANSHIPLVVGAYNAHSPARKVSSFSSVGPTRDHRPKPDLVAPGDGVLSARSAPRDWRTNSGLFVRKSGTSMAAPHVTGAVALCLQGARRPLRCHEIRELILSNAEPATAQGQYSLRFGRGYLDVAKVAEAVLALPPRVTTSSVYPQADVKAHISRAKESKVNNKLDEYFDRLEQVIKETSSRAASERDLLAQIMRTTGAAFSSNSIDPDKLYQALAFSRNGSLPAKIGESFTVLARPGESPNASPQTGDVLLRVALGEPGLGHVAVISDSTLWSHKQLANAPFRSESQRPGFYATVIEGGAFPHTHSDQYARRILDSEERMPPGQLLFRPILTIDDESGVDSLTSAFEGELFDEEPVIQGDAVISNEQHQRDYDFEATDDEREDKCALRLRLGDETESGCADAAAVGLREFVDCPLAEDVGFAEQPAPQPPPAPPAPAVPDSSVANRFIAAHRTRYCTPGQAGSANCQTLAAPRPIRRVVIHALAVPSTARRSGVEAVVAGWQNAGRQASSHYLVDRDGTITQMVREADVAFHTPGNNRDSIGIEHADLCNDPAPLTTQLYERSAALVRDLATRHGFAINNNTVAGHSQVNPNHGDPGPYWDWEYYFLLLAWAGMGAASRPIRLVTVAANRPAAPTGWQVQRRSAIADDHCASQRDPWGATYWRAQSSATGAAAELSLVVDEACTYKLSLWWPDVAGANSAVPVDIEVGCLTSPCTGTSTQTVTVNQRPNAGRWNDVAVVNVTQTPAEVKVRWHRNSAQPGWILVDGVRLLKIASCPGSRGAREAEMVAFEYDAEDLGSDTADYSLQEIANGTLGKLPDDILAAILTTGESDSKDLTDRVFWRNHSDLSGQTLDPKDPKQKKLREEWGMILRRQVKPIIWLRQIIDQLDRHRGDIPREFLLGWMAAESDGKVFTVSKLKERGYFQIMWRSGEAKEQLGLTPAEFERLSTDREFSIEKGIQLAKIYRQHFLKYFSVPDGSDLLWRLTKGRHGYPSDLDKVLRQLGTTITWQAISQSLPKIASGVNRTLNYAAKLKPLADRVPAPAAATPEIHAESSPWIPGSEYEDRMFEVAAEQATEEDLAEFDEEEMLGGDATAAETSTAAGGSAAKAPPIAVSGWPLGVDLYSGNYIDAAGFKNLKNRGKTFAIAKSSQGRTPDRWGATNRTFLNYYRWIRDSGMIRGSFHFFANKHSAHAVWGGSIADQANVVISLVKRLEPGDLAPALDLEDEPRLRNGHPVPDGSPPGTGRYPLDQGLQPTEQGYQYRHIRAYTDHGSAGRAELLTDIQDFLNRIETALGRTPIIYTSHMWADSDMMNDPQVMSQYPLWTVYHRGPDLNGIKVGAWGKNWDFIQYAEQGKKYWTLDPYNEPNINIGGLDFDAYNGTIYGLRGLADIGRPGVALSVVPPGLGLNSVPYIAHAEIDNSLHLMTGSAWADRNLSAGDLQDRGADPVLLASLNSLFLYFRSGNHIIEATATRANNWQWNSDKIDALPIPIHDPRAVLSGNRRFVVYWGDDDDWHLQTWHGSWVSSGGLLSRANVRTAMGGRSTGQPTVYVTQEVVHVVGRVDIDGHRRIDTDGHLFDLWLDGAVWRNDDITALARRFVPDMPAATYSPCAYETSAGVAIAFRAVRGDIWVIRRSDNAPVNVTTAAHAKSAAGHPTCFVLHNKPHIVYRGTDRLIYDIWLDGGVWHVRQICTAQAAADPVATTNGTIALAAVRTHDGIIHAAQFDGTIWTCVPTTKATMLPQSSAPGDFPGGGGGGVALRPRLSETLTFAEGEETPGEGEGDGGSGGIDREPARPPFPKSFQEPLSWHEDVSLRHAFRDAISTVSDDAHKVAYDANGALPAASTIPIVIASLDPGGKLSFAGQNMFQMYYSGSLLKVAAMYAAFQLRKAVADFANTLPSGLTQDEVFKRFSKAFDAKILASAPAIPAGSRRAPKYADILKVTPDGVHYKVEFLTVPDPSRRNFDGHLYRMIEESHNPSAGVCIQNLGYSWINGVLRAAGMFKEDTSKPRTSLDRFAGIWLAGDYLYGKPYIDAEHQKFLRNAARNAGDPPVEFDVYAEEEFQMGISGLTPVRIPCFNEQAWHAGGGLGDGRSQQATRCLDMANLFVQVANGTLIKDDAAANTTIRDMLKTAVPRSIIGRWAPSTHFKVLQSKIGFGTLGSSGSCNPARATGLTNGCVLSEAMVIQENAPPNRKYVVVYQDIRDPGNHSNKDLERVRDIIEITIDKF